MHLPVDSMPADAEHDVSKYGYVQELERTMNVWQLTAFGLNYMVPIAPAIIFGILLKLSGGTVALPYLLAGIAMLFTAFSYAVMVRNFPLAGSVYSYVGRGWNPYLGFLAGWVLTLDYILIPTVTASSSAYFAQQYLPHVPYWMLLGVFSVGTGMINLFGVQLMSRLGLWLLALGEFVVWLSILVWGRAVLVHHVGTGTLLSTSPFQFDSMSSLAAATSLAIFSFLGFDAITTLAEETRRPKRDIPRAIYWCIGIGTLTMFACGYVAMLVIPDWRQHIGNETWVNTTLFQVSRMTGGEGFGLFFTAGYLTELGVFNIVATAAGARLLFGMGRDTLLPKAIFAKVNRRWRTPHWSILLICAIEFILGNLANMDTLSNLVNYGAMFAFAALNLAVIWLYYVRRDGELTSAIGTLVRAKPAGAQHVRYLLMPLVGFVVIVYVWINMDSLAQIIGTTWLVAGIGYLLIKTRGFRQLPPSLDL
ncbi:APC family permease [Burkholderia sp. Ac-20353]|uniref:APC family permease n=1 Tax=Burkholderia sp. Ac-20353 TaxID=2703894 RepID=UPI00197C260F|nr:APC family permease [Burkholderia sp. Ac-20353]MBN3786935.1 APC family permease [Burkholderia sp. Ac-20353]